MKLGVLVALGAALGAFAIWLRIAAKPSEPPAPTPAVAPAPAAVAPAPGSSQPQLPPSPVAPAPVLAPEPSERERWVKPVLRSGSGHEQWTERGTSLLEQIGRNAVRSDDVGCYIAGCTATYTFASRDEYDRTIHAVQRSAEYQAWTGGKRWTTPEPAHDGAVTSALVLYRPD